MVEEDNKKVEEKMEVKTEEIKVEDKKTETKKKVEKKIEPKDKAIARGVSMKVSPKHCFAICKAIKGKSPRRAVEILEAVVAKKFAIRMENREVGHKKGKDVSGAKFPKNAAKAVMEVVKQVDANAVVAMVENPIITLAKADFASAPFRSGGRKAKRTHILLEVRNRTKLKGLKN